MTYDDRRIASWIANALTHRHGEESPCNNVGMVLARNAARKAPFPEDAIRRLYPAACALVRNAELVMDRIGVIRELKAQGRPIPADMNCKLCDLPGITRLEER